jgi:hypothetical protein
MSRIFERGMAWHTYLNLEKDFTDTIRYVALDVNNRTVWSEKLAQQLLLTGSILDSIFMAGSNPSRPLLKTEAQNGGTPTTM